MVPMKRVTPTATNSLYAYCLYFSSGALARKMERLAQKAWKPVGLSPSLAYILMLALDCRITYPSSLVKELLLSPSTITRMIRKLEARDLVRLDKYEHLNIVTPTDKAWDLQPRLWECQEVFYQQCLRLLGEDGQKLAAAMNQATDKLTTFATEN